MAAGLLGIWGAPGALQGTWGVTALRDCWAVLGIWGEVLLDGELLGSFGGLENREISGGSAGCSALSRPLGQSRP